MRAMAKKYPGKLAILGMDVSSEGSIRRACRRVARGCRQLDLLVNVAGIFFNDGLARVNMRNLAHMMEVNAFGPLLLIKHLRFLLRTARGKVVNVSSESGSLAGVTGERPIYAYGASKAALNMFMRRAAFELAREGVTLISIHPGWMNTTMGRRSGAHPPQEPADTAADIMKLAGRMNAATSGGFFFHHGKRHPW